MSLARDVTTVGGATLLSRLLGFVRDAGIAAVLGAGVYSDAFFAVLQIANFFRRLLAEGALNAAFVPLWLKIKTAAGERAADRFFSDVLRAMLLAAGALALVAVLFAPAVIGLLAPGFDGERHAWGAAYLRDAALYVPLAAAVAVLAAVLNAQGRIAAVAVGIVAFNAVLLLVLALAAVFGPALPAQVGAMLALAIVLAGAAQLAVTGIGFLRLRRAFVRLPRAPSGETRHFFALAGPGLVAAGIPQLKLIAGAMIASKSPAAVSWLYYANRLYELPLGVVSIIVAAVLMPAMAASLRRAGDAASAPAQSRAIEIGLGLALPAAVGFAILAEPIARALFERGAFAARDTAAVAAALAAICAGLPGHTLEKVFGAVSFARADTRTPMLAALAGLAAAVAASLAAFPRYGHVGVAAAIAASGWVGSALLGTILWRRGWLRLDRGAAQRLARIVLVTLVMGAAVFGVHRLSAVPLDAAGAPARLAALAAMIALGLAVYGAGLELLGVARLRDLVATIRAGGAAED